MLQLTERGLNGERLVLSHQPPVEEETAPEGSPLPAPGSFVQELFQAQYRYEDEF